MIFFTSVGLGKRITLAEIPLGIGKCLLYKLIQIWYMAY
jgi:hypothetical protein